MTFSVVKNTNSLNLQRETFNKTQEPGQKNMDQTENLKIFNGLKAVMVAYVIFGSTFFFSWYSILGNPTFVTEITSAWSFVFIEGAFFTVPVFFMFNGFL
mmetsp:Transcript_89167/g.123028  ORF Transcript_89167/g.123028 Transcript_89167/m.123028 type:complete len:100 (+) Transcript_89167:830-1129(+)